MCIFILRDSTIILDQGRGDAGNNVSGLKTARSVERVICCIKKMSVQHSQKTSKSFWLHSRQFQRDREALEMVHIVAKIYAEIR